VTDSDAAEGLMPAKIREQERRRIARDLHDDVLQQLVGISHLAGLLDLTLEQQQTISDAVTGVEAQLRRVIYDLRPHDWDRPLVEAIRALPTGDVRLRLCTHVDPDTESALPATLKLAFWRALQEAINNAVRHAEVGEIRVTLALDSQALHFEVSDQGVGFDPTMPQRPDRFGLLLMQEQVEAEGGTLDIVSQPHQGTQVRVTIPLSPQSV